MMVEDIIKKYICEGKFSDSEIKKIIENINDDIWFKNKSLVKNQIGVFINVLS